MNLELLWRSARNACFKYADGGLYETCAVYDASLNGKPVMQVSTCVFSMLTLLPDTQYMLELFLQGTLVAALSFRTEPEFVTLNVRAFGAWGDAEHDDTPAIQAAIAACPAKSRVLIPKGRYLVSPLFLKSDIRLEIQEGAVLLLHPQREKSPILPGIIPSYNEAEDYNLGTWEGNPLDMHAALLTGIDVHNVEIYGSGRLDGQAPLGSWWQTPKDKRGGAWRGRMLFLNRSSNVTLQGLQFTNSPSWNLHPYFSNNLRFLNLSVQAPADSPNTDGLNPESCNGVMVAGTSFSLGDDCIAIKAGKLYMGMTYREPCQRLHIMHCKMAHGHGGITIGSEMSGGVRDVWVHDCLMLNTDRGLRIKTRRGRGEQGIIDNIRFERVRMEGVLSPIVINSFYYCDPDGHGALVQDRAPKPVDAGTPAIRRLSFDELYVTGAHTCAAFLLGLPEKKIASVRMTGCRFGFSPDAAASVPAMADGVASCLRQGIIAQNVEELRLSRVTFDGIEGVPILAINVDNVIWEDKT